MPPSPNANPIIRLPTMERPRGARVCAMTTPSGGEARLVEIAIDGPVVTALDANGRLEFAFGGRVVVAPGRDDTDALFKEPAVRAELQRVVGNQLPKLMQNLNVRGPVDHVGGVGAQGDAHGCELGRVAAGVNRAGAHAPGTRR